ncbi:MAG: ABC transporter permease subunit [Planctomycetota bacterium]
MAGILTVSSIETRKLLSQRSFLLTTLLLLLAWKLIVLYEVIAGGKSDGLIDFEINGFYLVARSAGIGLTLWVVLLFVLAGNSLAGESERGQLRMLLVRPATRSSHYLGKLLALLAATLLALTADALIGALVGGFFLGFGDVADTSLQGEMYSSGALALDLLIAYLLTGLALLATASLALCLSALFRQATTAITVGLLLLVTSSAVGFVYGEPIDRFLVTTWDLRSFSVLEKVTAGTSVYRQSSDTVQAVLIPLITLAVSTWVGLLSFRSRDVLN